jgi:hypothetical protein
MAELLKKIDTYRRALAKVTSDGVKVRRQLAAITARLKKLEAESRAIGAASKRAVKDVPSISRSEPRWANLF